MLETKVVDCESNLVKSVISEYESFGWNVLNVQKKDYEANGVNQIVEPSEYDNVLNTNDDTDKIITFQRDNQMKEYDKIIELENEYFKTKTKYYENMQKYRDKTLYKQFFIPSIICFAFAIITSESIESFKSLFIFLITELSFLASGLILLAINFIYAMKKNDKNKEIRKSFDKDYNHFHECMDQAKSLLSDATNTGKKDNIISMDTFNSNIDDIVDSVLKDDETISVSSEKGNVVVISENKYKEYQNIINKGKDN